MFCELLLGDCFFKVRIRISRQPCEAALCNLQPLAKVVVHDFLSEFSNMFFFKWLSFSLLVWP